MTGWPHKTKSAMDVARNSPVAIQAMGNCQATTAETEVPTKAAHASRRNLREGANRAWGLLMLKDYHCSGERISGSLACFLTVAVRWAEEQNRDCQGAGLEGWINH